MLNVVFTKLCSVGEISFSANEGGCLGGWDELDMRRPGGDPLMKSSVRGESMAGESGISKLASMRIASDFWKSALTLRRKGMLSCGRNSCDAKLRLKMK